MRKLLNIVPSLNEDIVEPADVKAIFTTAAELRNAPATGFRRFFKTKQDKLSPSDLQKAWQQAGYPDDIRDIESILTDFGFKEPEINKVFAEAFGNSGEDVYNEVEASPAVLKIAEYAKKAGIDKEIIAFLQKEYGFKESHKFSGKAVIEDIRQIFDKIVHEERTGLQEIIRSTEHTHLGRYRK